MSSRRTSQGTYLSDLTVLFSLVPDPFSLREQLDLRNAHRIAAARALDNDEHEAWLLLPRTQRLERSPPAP